MPIWNWNLPPFTAGSVPFGAASGVLTQNNANLFWNNTTLSLLLGSQTNLPAPVAGVILQAQGQFGKFYRTSSDNTGFQFAWVKSRAGGADVAGDSLGDLAWNGVNSTPAEIQLALLRATIDTVTAGSEASSLHFFVATAGASSERMTITGVGSVGIGQTSPGSILHVGGPITTATRTVSANATLGGTDSVLFVDATGAARTITLPAASASTIGRMYYVYKIDASANGVTVAAAGTDTIVGNTAAITTQWQLGFVMGQTATQWIIRKL